MDLLKALVSIPNSRFSALGALVIIYLIENGSTSSKEIADYLDKSQIEVTDLVSYLKKAGWIELDKLCTLKGIALSSRTGELITTTTRCGSYRITEKLKLLLENHHG